MESASWIKKKSAASLHPAQVETTLLQLNEAWPEAAGPLPDAIQNFPLGEAALLHLFAVSSICAARIVQNPDLLLWLSQPEICRQGRDHIEMANELYRMADTDVAANNFRILRRWKNKEMTRIALRELANAAALEETTAELSQLAEICVREVFAHWNAKLRESSGSPAADFAILALGKLGGRELNHSSDVDLIFLYSEEGELSPRLSHHQWFNRLAEKILETFSTRDPEGALFRIDLRLRPEGSAGPLARSLESMENYYAGFGETWERIALIKARGIAGSRELTYEFLRQHQPFIYPRSPTPDLLDEIARIKRRIERDVARSDALDRDVKLGRGGIREIEFVVQTLQFIHGGRWRSSKLFRANKSSILIEPIASSVWLNTGCRLKRNNKLTPLRANRWLSKDSRAVSGLIQPTNSPRPSGRRCRMFDRLLIGSSYPPRQKARYQI
jgi:glutamine synthetase adenylyltransferase